MTTIYKLEKISITRGSKKLNWKCTHINGGIATSAFLATTFDELVERYNSIGTDFKSLVIGEQLFIY